MNAHQPISVVRAYVEGALLSGQSVEDDENLLLSGLIDSLGVMQLVAFLEKEFEARIPTSDLTLENFMSLDAIASYVARITGAR